MANMIARMSLTGGLCKMLGPAGVNMNLVRHLKVGPKGTVVAKMVPTLVKLEAGKKYSWCLCGLSKKQPFCDGAHKGTEFKPVRFEVDASKRYLMCRCKQTSNQPFCDMTHVKVMFQAATGQLKTTP